MKKIINTGLFLMLISLSQLSISDTNVIGKTYPIAETNLLKQIKEKSNSVDLQKEFKGTQDFSFNASLNRVTKDKQTKRIITPDYVLPFEVRTKKGLLYPKNYKFNPLNHFTLPSSIVIVEDEIDYQLIKNNPSIKPNAMFIATSNPVGMNKGRSDSAHFFMLTPETAKRLKIKAVPSIINQIESQLEIIEIYVDRESIKDEI